MIPLRCLLLVLGLLLPAFSVAQQPAAVTKLTLNTGTPQRSTLTTIALEFSADVAAYLTKEHLVLRNLTTGQTLDPAVFDLTYNPTTHLATWTFPTLPAKSLVDGNYLAVLKADALLAPLANRTIVSPGLGLADSVFTFHRRFGDSDGDRDVDFLDTARFRKTWNQPSTSASYAREFDANLDGTVNVLDLNVFKQNYFIFFPPIAAIHASLFNDTGLSTSDGLTTDPTVTGIVFRPNPNTTFRAGLSLSTASAPLPIDTTVDLAADGTFLFTPARLAQIKGSPLDPGAYKLHLETVESGAASSFFDLLFTLGSAVPCDLTMEAGWTTTISAPANLVQNAIPGSVTFANCEAVLREGDSFQVTLERTFTIPPNAGLLAITYEAPTFDTSATRLMRDAFEAALVDATGRPLTFTIQGAAGVTPATSTSPQILPATPDAAFNHSDGKAPFSAPGAASVPSTFNPQLSTVFLDVSFLPPGSSTHVILRLVNNDRDRASHVRITEVQFKPSDPTINLAGSPLTALSLLVGAGTSGGGSPNPNNTGSGSPTFGSGGPSGPKIVFGTTSTIGGGGPSPTLVTDPNDPRTWQGASVGTFAQLYFGTNTLANRQRVIDNRLLDAGLFNLANTFPATLVSTPWALGTAGGDHRGGFDRGRSLDTTGTGVFDYTTSVPTLTIFDLANAIDDLWFQTSNTIGDTVFDLGVPSLKAAVFNTIDHGPLPLEAIESTAYLSNDRVNWTQAVVQRVWLEGWQPILGIKWDGFAFAVGTADNTPFRYVSMIHGGPGGLQSDGDDEINGILGLDNDFNPTIRIASPTVAIVSPADNSRQAAPRTALLTGYAVADRPLLSPGTLATNRIVLVTVNGQPVDTLDPAGNFFSAIELRPGANTFTVVATDAYNLSTINAITVYGDTSATNTSTLGVVSGSILGEYGRTTFHERTRTLYADLAVRNAGSYPIRTPLYVGITNISDPSVRLLGSDGISGDGIPYYDYSAAVPSGALNPQQTTLNRSIAFYNPNHVQFRYDLVVLGQLNQAPFFTTTPPLEAVPTRAYSYPAKATDPDGDTVTYSLIQSPAGLAIVAATGLVSWTPTAAQLGNHDVRIRADDGKGGIAEQHYLISVITAPANRPPYFISTPVNVARPSTETITTPEPFDLTQWQVVQIPIGSQPPANWAVSASKTSVTQTVNSDPSAFVSDIVLQNSAVNGSWTVATNAGDDDYMGFVFGYQDAQHFYLFDWKKGDQSDCGGLGEQGMSVKVVSASSALQCEDLWPTAGNASRVRSIVHNRVPWAFGVSYSFELKVRDGGFVITVKQGTTILATIDLNDASYGPGRFGFYNNSQGSVTYSGFARRSLPVSTYSYDSDALDPDSDTLTYSLITSPVGMTINPATGEVRWAPTIAQLGVHDVSIQVSDGHGGTATQTYQVYVLTVVDEHAPIIVTCPPTGVVAGQTYSYDVDALDPDRDVLTYQLIESPAGASIDATSGLITWPTASTAPGSQNFTVRAVDPSGAFDQQRFPVGVVATAQAGGIRGTKFRDADGNGMRTIQGTVQTRTMAVTVLGSGSIVAANPTTELTVNGGLARNGLVPYGGYFKYIDRAFNEETTWSIDPVLRFPDGTTSILSDQSRGGFGAPQHVGDGLMRCVADVRGVHVEADTELLGRNARTTFRFSGADLTGIRFVFYAENDLFAASDAATFGGSIANGDLALYMFDTAAGGLSVVMTTATGPGSLLDLFGCGVWTGWGTALEGGNLSVLSADGSNFVRNGDLGLAFGYSLSGQSATLSVNYNGTADLPDPGLPGWTIYLDENCNGRRDSSERFTVTDQNGDYAFTGLAPGTYLVAEEAQLNWIQTAPPLRRHTVTISSGQMASGLEFGNMPAPGGSLQRDPAFITTPTTTAIPARELFRYPSLAVDPDGDPLTYNLVTSPNGMVVESTTGLVAWRPTINQIGTHDVILRAQDGKGGVALQAFKLTVVAANSAPVITSFPPNPAVAGLPYAYAIRAQDADGQPLTFTLGAGTPAGLALDPQFATTTSALLRWTPTLSQVGTYALQIIARDSAGGETRQSYNLDVVASAQNHAPDFTTAPRTQTRLALPYAYLAEAADADGDPLSFELVAGPPGMTLANPTPRIFNATLVQWTPTPAQLGPNPVTLRVRDGRGGAKDQTFTIQVGSTLTNQPPVIVSTPPLQATAGQPYAYDLRATDPDGDDVNWQLISGPIGMSIDPASGALRWNPTLDQLGAKTVTVQAADSLLASATQTWTINVGALNRPPRITSTAPVAAQTSELYLYAPRAVDPEGDALTWALVANPTGMTIDTATGLIRWTPATIQTGSATVTLRVSDGRGGSDTQSYTLTTGNIRANHPPVIVTTPSGGATALRLYTYAIRATDSDSQTLTLALRANPAGATLATTASVNGQVDGLISWTPTAAQTGPQEFIVTATDPLGGSAAQRFLVTVRQNDPPVITSTPRLDAAPTAGYRYDVQASDANGDPLTYNLTQSPVGMNIDSLGRIAWTPTNAQIGTAAVAVEVRDSFGGVGTQIYNITVAADTIPPVVTLDVAYNLLDAQGNKYVRVGVPAAITVNATDNVGVTLRELRLDGVAQPLNDGGATVATFTTAGVVQAVAKARDASGNESQITVGIPVVDPNAASTVAITIHSPLNDADVLKPTDVIGTITSQTPLRDYTLEYAELTSESGLGLNVDDPSLTYQSLAHVTLPPNTLQVTNSVLGKFDPTMLPNGGYLIRVTAFDINGMGRREGALVNVTGNLKLGEFRQEFTDLTVPLVGFPVEIKRIYDTRDSRRKGDFGYGWTLGLQDARILETGKKPFVGLGGEAKTFTTKTRVYLTAPDGRRIGFKHTPVFGAGGLIFVFYRPAFTADPGVYDKLEAVPSPAGYQLRGDGSLVGGFGLVELDPQAYRLTTREGVIYDYDQSFGLQKVTDLNGNTVTFTRDGIRHSSGVEIKFTRDAQGRITKITDPTGHDLLYNYDAAGDLIGATDRTALTTQFRYLPATQRAHYLNEIIDPLGRRAVKTEYGPDGRIVAIIDAQGNRQEQNFVPEQLTGTRTDARGNVTNLNFDARGNLLRETKPEGGVTCYEYNDPANQDKETATIDPLGNRTEYTWDASGNKLTEKDALGNVTRTTYNALNKITSLTQTNAQGAVLSSESAQYDARGNMTKVTNPAGDSRELIYDASGQLIASLDFAGHLTQYDYTNGCACGSPAKVTFADGTTKLYEYNGLGQVTKEIDETGAITRSTYDDSGRKLSDIDHDGKAITFAYDANDNQIRRVDRLGRITLSEYDASNLLKKEIKLLTDDNNNANDVIVQYEYDADGNLTALIDPAGNRTRFEFDRDGRMVRNIDAIGAVTRTDFDAGGNRTALVDRNGRRRTFGYDALNRPTQERWHDGSGAVLRTISFNYDALGRTTAISDPESTYTFQHNVAGSISRSSNAGTPGMPLLVLNYSYDKAGNTTAVTDNAGVSVQTTFDARGLSDRFTWSGGGIAPASVNFDRNGRGQITAIDRHSNATFTSSIGRTTYDQISPQGWVKQMQHRKADGRLLNAGANFTYNYDAEGQVLTGSSQGDVIAYGYDPVGQLISADHSIATYPDETYAYDVAGNRTQSHLHGNAYRTSPANRLLTDGVFNYSYDAEGNVIAKAEISTGQVTEYSFDHRGRLVAITDRLSVGGAIIDQVRFIHDTFDRRIGIVTNSVSYYIGYDGDNAWVEYDGAGAVQARRLFADTIDAGLASWYPATGTEWLESDVLGSLRFTTNGTGAVSSSSAFDSYGNSRTPQGQPANPTRRYGFTGRELIEDGLMHYRARAYSTETGRFLSEDPIGFGGSDYNLSRYVFNSPDNFTDPTGLVSSQEYSMLVRQISARVAKCVASVGLQVAGNYAEAAIYIYLANGKWYVGQTRQNPAARKAQHEGAKKIVIESFKVFKSNKLIDRKQLFALERWLYDIIAEELGPETYNKHKPLGDKKYKKYKNFKCK